MEATSDFDKKLILPPDISTTCESKNSSMALSLTFDARMFFFATLFFDFNAGGGGITALPFKGDPLFIDYTFSSDSTVSLIMIDFSPVLSF